MIVKVAAHYQLTLTGDQIKGSPKMTEFEMDLDPETITHDFKQHLASVTGHSAELMTVVYHGMVRGNSMTLADAPFTSSGSAKFPFVHVRMEDANLNAAVAAKLAEGSMVIPFDKIVIKPTQA